MHPMGQINKLISEQLVVALLLHKPSIVNKPNYIPIAMKLMQLSSALLPVLNKYVSPSNSVQMYCAPVFKCIYSLYRDHRKGLKTSDAECKR